MSVAPSIWPQAAASPPPRNESGPTSGEIEPAKHAGKRSRNSTPAAAGVKREREPDTPFAAAARERLAKEIAQSQVLEAARRAALGPRAALLEEIAESMGLLDEITDIVRHVDTLEIQTADAAISFRNVDDVLDPRKFEAAVNRARVAVRPEGAWRGTRKEHLPLGMKITRAARVVEEFHDTTTTWGWIRMFGNFEVDQDVSPTTKAMYYTPESRLPNGSQCLGEYMKRPSAAWREGDEALVHLGTLLGRLVQNGVKEVSSERELSTRLSQCGFRSEPHQRTFRCGGKALKVRVWSCDLCAVPDLTTDPADGAGDGSEEGGN